MIQQDSHTKLLFLGALFFCVSVNAQQPSAKEAEVPYLREVFAIELADTAAENGSQALSLEVFRRIMEHLELEDNGASALTNVPSAGGIQSSLLGTGSTTTAVAAASNSARLSRSAIGANATLERVFELLASWRRKKFDADQVASELQQAVMPQSQKDVVRNYAPARGQAALGIPQISMPTTTLGSGLQLNYTQGVRTTTQSLPPATSISAMQALQRFRDPIVAPSLGLHMIQWSAEAGRLEAVLAELRSRANETSGQDAHALIVMTLRTLGRADEANTYVEQLLQNNKLNVESWQFLVQCCMMPLPDDIARHAAHASDLAVATQVLSPATRERLLKTALDADPAGTAPYFQYVMRAAITADDMELLRKMTAHYVTHIRSLSRNAANSAWKELVAECFRLNRPHMALAALRYALPMSVVLFPTASPEAGTSSALAQNKQVAPSNQTALTSLTSDTNDQRLSALLGLCALPADKRFAVARPLVLDEPITSLEVFQFCSLPDCAAPLYFRSPQWQDAARLLKADPASHTASLLDVLLSDAAAGGKLDEIISSLLDKIPKDSEPIVRFLCEWMRLRADVYHQSLPERASSALPPLRVEEFKRWFVTLPAPIRTSLEAHYRRSSDNSFALAIDSLLTGNESSTKDPSTNSSDVAWSSSQSLKHWIGTPVPEPSNTQAYAGYKLPFRPWLISSNQELKAPQTSMALLLKYPLQGNMTLKLKVQHSGEDWSNNSFGGVINGAFLEFRGYTRDGSRVTLPAINARLTSSMNSSLRLNQDPQKAEPVELACHYENGVLALSMGSEKIAHTELSSQSFPFAGLIPSQLPAMQNAIELAGSPEIAPRVYLIDASLSGWRDQYFDRPLVDGLQVSSTDIAAPKSKTTATHVANWSFADDELRSNRQEAVTSSDMQARVRNAHNVLLYARPLLEGERFEFEAWQDSHTPIPSVVIGKTVLLVEDGQVRLHWIPNYSDIQFSGIDINNRGEDPDSRQLSKPKLNNDQWNKVSLRIEAGHMILSINGTDVYRRLVPAHTTTEFGLRAHPTSPSNRIRQATLTGPWPSRLPSDLWERQ